VRTDGPGRPKWRLNLGLVLKIRCFAPVLPAEGETLQEFVKKVKRIEARIVAIYDSERELNTSHEACSLRAYLESEKVELCPSSGPTVATVDNVCARCDCFHV
jgi:hypothetical protein